MYWVTVADGRYGKAHETLWSCEELRDMLRLLSAMLPETGGA